jgi:HK97 family phage major capsid protein
MHPEQRRLAEEIETLSRDIETLADESPATDADRETRAAMLAEAQAKIEKARAAYDFETKIAETRTRSRTLKTNTAALTIARPAAPARRPLTLTRNVPGYDSVESAEIAGRSLCALVRPELRGLFTGADEIANSMGETSPTYDGRGSELVVDELYRGILGLVSYQSLALRLAMVMETQGYRVQVPRSDDIVPVEWYAENVEIAPINLATAGSWITVGKMAARTQVSNELIEDSAYVSVANLVTQKFGLGFAVKLDTAWIQGDAAIGADGLLTKAAGGSNLLPNHEITPAGTKLSIDDLTACVGAISPYATNTAWLVSPAGWAAITAVDKGAIGATIGDATRPLVLGAPVYRVEGMPDSHLAIYGDFQQASQVAVKSRGLTIAASRDRAMEYDQTVFVATMRAGLVNSGMQYVAAIKKK